MESNVAGIVHFAKQICKLIVSGFRSMQTKTHVCQIQPGGFRHAMCRMLFGIFRLHVVKMTVELYQKHKNNAFALSTV